jgi:uncharacterized protein (TIGR00369 family)
VAALPDTPVDVAFLQATFQSCAFHRTLRESLEVVGAGKVRVRLAYSPDFDQGMGMLHGGVYSALLDTASYYAGLSACAARGRLPLTQEYKINLLASARQEDLVADAEVVRMGERVAVVETRISTASGKLVAIGLTSLLLS